MAIAADASTSTDFPLRAERMLLMKRLPPRLQQCVIRMLIIVVLLLETKHISCANLSYTTVVLLVFLLYQSYIPIYTNHYSLLLFIV